MGLVAVLDGIALYLQEVRGGRERWLGPTPLAFISPEVERSFVCNAKPGRSQPYFFYPECRDGACPQNIVLY